jgi:signal transduction histidine kinase
VPPRCRLSRSLGASAPFPSPSCPTSSRASPTGHCLGWQEPKANVKRWVRPADKTTEAVSMRDTPSLDEARILVVDDEPANVQLLQRALEQAGYVNVEATTDSRRVAGLLTEYEPDLILLDLVMPHLDGFEVLEQLAHLVPASTYLPVLVLTADITGETKRRALAGGAKDFLTKPFDLDEVFLRIRNMLEIRQLHMQLRRQNEELEERVRMRTLELESVRVVSEAVGASLDLDQVLQSALQHSLEVTELDMGSVSLLDEGTGELLLVADRNIAEPAATGLPVPDSVLGQVLARPRIISGVTLELPLPSREGPEASQRTAALVAAPLEWEGRAIGVLSLASLDGRTPDADDLALVAALARPIAAAVGNARLYGALRQLEEQRRELLARLVRAEEEERRRIAADIHDDPIQVISALGLRLDLLRRSLSDPEHLALMENARGTLDAAVAGLRNMLFQLHPPALDREGLMPPLRALLDQLQEEAGLRVRLEARTAGEPPPEVRSVLYRIVQEALANVRKHARATSVSVLLEEREGGFGVRVEDDGEGFASGDMGPLRGHLGLPGMRERAELAGGWSRVNSAPGAGTTVEAWVPGEPASVVA